MSNTELNRLRQDITQMQVLLLERMDLLIRTQLQLMRRMNEMEKERRPLANVH